MLPAGSNLLLPSAQVQDEIKYGVSSRNLCFPPQIAVDARALISDWTSTPFSEPTQSNHLNTRCSATRGFARLHWDGCSGRRAAATGCCLDTQMERWNRLPCS